jgi:DNA-binding NarL/FixJ family response regulator
VGPVSNQKPALDQARIVVAIARPILASIVRNALHVAPGLEVFETDDPDEAPMLARRLEAQVVIVEQGDGTLSDRSLELLRCQPDVRVLLLANDGREGFVWALQPHQRVLGELSTASLCGVVRQLVGQEVV